MLSFGTILSFSLLIFIGVGAHPLIGIDGKGLEPSSRSTNAMRLARGLPPLPPTKRYTPHAHLARRSAAPGTESKGSICMKKSSDQSILGYPGNSADYLETTPAELFTYKQPAVTGDFIQFNYLSNTGSTVGAYITTPSDSSLQSSAVMGPGLTTVLKLSWWGISTPVGATPFATRGYRAETTIFSIADNGKITTTWVNYDGNRVTVFPCVNGRFWTLVGSTSACTGILADMFYQ